MFAPFTRVSVGYRKPVNFAIAADQVPGSGLAPDQGYLCDLVQTGVSCSPMLPRNESRSPQAARGPSGTRAFREFECNEQYRGEFDQRERWRMDRP